MAVITASLPSYIRAFAYMQDSPGRPSFIEGSNVPVGNNTLPIWGASPGTEGVQHKYIPLNSYINSIISTITANKSMTIVSYGIIMRLLTRDGNLDIDTLTLDDSAQLNNDGTILNRPTWIPGPHD